MLANVRDEYSFKIIDPPAIPDLDDEVKPKKKLIVIIGSILGLSISILFAIFKNFVKTGNSREKRES